MSRYLISFECINGDYDIVTIEAPSIIGSIDKIEDDYKIDPQRIVSIVNIDME